MPAPKYAALIMFGDQHKDIAFYNNKDLNLKKLLTNNTSFARNTIHTHPTVEVVDNYNCILEDRSIRLIVILKECINSVRLAGEALRSGKQVRIV